MKQFYSYIIIGAGLAGVSAIDGIRKLDRDGDILLIGRENHLPYDRPPLSKKLWTGKKKPDDIVLHDWNYYVRNKATLNLGRTVTSIDAGARTVADDAGRKFRFEKLLIATGGLPRALPIPGGSLDGIVYYRTIDDYQRVRARALPGSKAAVIGGGFIGSEMAASLSMNNVQVTMIFPDPYLVNRVFPTRLGQALQRTFEGRGIRVLSQDRPSAITAADSGFRVRTDSGEELDADILLVGAGITPSLVLAAHAGLRTGNGIIVNDRLETSVPGIYAAGDNAFFPYRILGREMRVEHWDNALSQGIQAGRNMAGANEPYLHMPYFFSDLFEFGYEAVGDVSTSLETVEDWQKEYDTGIIYYVQDTRIRGVMLCNIWEKVDWARRLIRDGERPDVKRLRAQMPKAA